MNYKKNDWRKNLLTRVISFLYRDEVGSKVGDFLEYYEDDIIERGELRAFYGLMNQILCSLPSLFVNKFYWGGNLFINYIKIALRNILRYKVFSTINIFGFAISISLCLLVIQLLFAMYNQDTFHKDAERIYRVNTTRALENGSQMIEASAPTPLADWLVENNDVECAVKINNRLKGYVKHRDEYIYFKGLYVNPEFLKTFSFNLDVGNKESALREPYSIVLTKPLAEKYFGEKDPIGEIFPVKDLGDFTVTGVIEDLSDKKSHLRFEALVSLTSMPSLYAEDFNNPHKNDWKDFFDTNVFIKLKKNQDAAEVENLISSIIRERYTEEDRIVEFHLQSLPDISPGPNLANQPSSPVPPVLPFVLSGIALLILLIAAFNYNNLTIAKSLSRAKEIGVRKVIGASRKNIFIQFIGEAVVTSLVSLFIAYLILQFWKMGLHSLSPELSGKINLGMELNIYLFLSFFGFAVLSGMVSGIIPAVYISRFKPTDALKDISSIGRSSRFSMKKALTVSQFFISLVFVVLILVGIKQVDYLRSIDFGYETENIVNIKLQGNDYQVLTNELSAFSGIESISFADYMPGMGMAAFDFVYPENFDEPIQVSFLPVGRNFIDHMNIKMVVGENFPDDVESGEERFLIINEKAVTVLGYSNPAEALGKTVSFKEGKILTIIGVVKDFVILNYDSPIQPLLIRVIPEYFRTISIKYSTGRKEEIAKLIEDKWQVIDPVNTVKYSFYAEEIEESFAGPEMMLKVLGFISSLTLLIAYFGLLGMVIFEMESKVKDIGIRKVLGAELSGLIITQSKGFLKLLFIASSLALPISYLLGDLFLQNMAFRVELGYEPFLFGVFIVVVAGSAIIFSQTIRAALSNPVDCLRNE